MSNIPFLWTVKTTGLTEAEFLNTVCKLEECIERVNETVIDKTKVELDLMLIVPSKNDFNKEEIFYEENIVKWIREEFVPGDQITLKISTNRFIFDWFAQGITDFGAICEKWRRVKNWPGNVFDTLQPILSEKEESSVKGFFSRLKDNIGPALELASQNKGAIASVALMAGSVLFAKKLQDELVKTTEETVRKTMREYEPPTVEIHIDENGYFDDVAIDR